MKNIRNIVIFYIKYYSFLCSFWLLLTMLAGLIDSKFGTGLYGFFYTVSPTMSFPVFSVFGMLLISIIFNMCLWNYILYIPLIFASIYSQAYKFGVKIDNLTYKLIALILLCFIASAASYFYGQKFKKTNHSKSEAVDKKNKWRCLRQLNGRSIKQANTRSERNRIGRKRISL